MKRRRRIDKRTAAAKCVMPDCDHPAAPNSTICQPDQVRAFNGLLALGSFAHDSYEYELAGVLAKSTTPRLSGSKNPPMGVDDALANHRFAVRQLLKSWALNVADERNIGTINITGITPLAGPLCPRPATAFCGHDSCRRLVMSRRPDYDGVYGILAAFLRRHHDWIMCQYFAKDYAGEIIDHADTAWQLLNPSGTRIQRDIGPCPEDGCGGSLYAIRRADEELLPSAIKCDACGHEIPSDRWLKFGRRLLERQQMEQTA